MRKYLSISLLLYLLFAVTHANAQATVQQKEVQQTMVKIFDGMSALDLAEVQKYSTKDLMILENGAVWNMDTLAVKIAPLRKVSFSRVNHLDFIQTEISGNTAWVAYHNAADYIINGQKMNKQWMESAFLIKEGDNWKVMLLHSTVIQAGGR